MQSQELFLPDGAQQDEQLLVSEILIAPGMKISKGQVLLVIEAAKASIEIESPQTGEITDIYVEEGQEVEEGKAYARINVSTTDVEPKAATESSSKSDTKSDRHSSSKAEKVTVDHDQEAVETEQIQYRLQDFGAVEEVVISEVLVSEGQSLVKGDVLVTVEAEKTVADVAVDYDCVVEKLFVETGATVLIGSVIAQLLTTKDTSTKNTSNTSTVSKVAPVEQVQQPKTAPVQTKRRSKSVGSGTYAGPAVRKLAKNLGVDLSKVEGTSDFGRVSSEDLYSYVKKHLSTQTIALPKATQRLSWPGPVRVEKLTSVKAYAAKNLTSSWIVSPQVTQFEEANVENLELERGKLKQQGKKITPLAFWVKACCIALNEHYLLRSELNEDGKSITIKSFYNIGIAVNTERGLLVPVIKDCDRLNVEQIAEEIKSLSIAAKNNKLKPEQMQDAVFTVSSLGSVGGTNFTPLVNYPQVGILGIAKMQSRPIVKVVGTEQEISIAKVNNFSLSYNHRIVNGVDAVLFTETVKKLIEESERLC